MSSAEYAVESDEEGRLQYKKSLTYVFDNPEWLPTIAWGSLALFSVNVIPVVGQLVWMGYAFQVLEKLHTNPKDDYPVFVIDRFVDYLMRGVWLFLVSLAMMVVVLPVMVVFLAIFAMIAGIALSIVGEPNAGPVVLLLVLVFVPCFLAFYGLVSLLCAPFLLRAGLCQDFMQAMNLPFANDFLRKTWKELLMAGCFFVGISFVASLVGILACGIGLFPAIAWTMLVQAHLLWQIYELYLKRGGEPIPLRASQ